MKKFTLLFVIFYLVSGFTSRNLEGLDWVLEANRKLLSSKQVSLNYSIRTSCDEEPGKVTEKVVVGKYVRKGDHQVLTNGNILTILQDNYVLNVSSDDKTIFLSEKAEQPEFSVFIDLFSKDSTQFSASKEVLKDGRRQVYVKPNSDSEYDYLSQVKYLISQKGWIQSVTMYFDRDKQRQAENKCDWMKVEYSNYKFDLSKEALPKIQDYIVIVKGKAVLKPAYQDFELISSLNLEMP